MERRGSGGASRATRHQSTRDGSRLLVRVGPSFKMDEKLEQAPRVTPFAIHSHWAFGRCALLSALQFLSPLRGFVLIVQGIVELDELMECFRDNASRLGRQRLFLRLETFVDLEQERLRFLVLLLP